jgi:hypothetical protein
MDSLEVATTSPGRDQAPVEIIQPRMTNGNIAVHLHDGVSPGTSTLDELPKFLDRTACPTCTSFQTTCDLFMPASDPPDGTITFTNVPRGEAGKPQVLRVPNWASEGHLITLMFNDYAQ